MSIYNPFRGYDQWKTASPYDKPECFDYTEQFMRDYGRIGHGLCGKNADLNYGGQIVVEFAGIAENDFIVDFYPYATICGNAEWSEEQWELATEILIFESDFPAEYSGDDSWFASPFAGLFAKESKWTIKVPLTIADIEDCSDYSQISKDTLDSAYHAVFDRCRDFQESATRVQKALDAV